MFLKKPLLILLFFMLLIFGYAQANKPFEKAVNQGELALANQEYDKALASFKLALSEKKDEDIQKLYNKIHKFLRGLELKKQGDLEKAIIMMDEALKIEMDSQSFDKHIREERKMLVAQKNEQEKWKGELAKGDELLASQKYDEAKMVFEQITAQVKDKQEFSAIYQQSSEKLNNVSNEIARIELEEERQNQETTSNKQDETKQGQEQKEEQTSNSSLSLGEMRRKAKAYVDEWNGYDNLLVDEYNSGDVRVYEFKDGESEHIVSVTVNLKTGEVKDDSGMYQHFILD